MYLLRTRHTTPISREHLPLPASRSVQGPSVSVYTSPTARTTLLTTRNAVCHPLRFSRPGPVPDYVQPRYVAAMLTQQLPGVHPGVTVRPHMLSEHISIVSHVNSPRERICYLGRGWGQYVPYSEGRANIVGIPPDVCTDGISVAR